MLASAAEQTKNCETGKDKEEEEIRGMRGAIASQAIVASCAKRGDKIRQRKRGGR